MIDIRNEYNVDCSKAKGAYLESVPEWIWDDPRWYMEPKKDAQRITMQIGDGKSLLRGRNRQDFLKGVEKAGDFPDKASLSPVLAAYTDPMLDGTVLDGELTESYKMNGEYDKDTVRRIENGEWVGYEVWTVMFWKGEDVRGMSDEERKMLAGMAVEEMRRMGMKVRLLPDWPATLKNLKKVFADNEEGAILKCWDATIPTHQRTNPNWWKCKGDDDRTVDAFVIGVTEAKEGGSGIRGIAPQPNGKAATFTVGLAKDGHVVEVGKLENLPKDAVEFGLRNFHDYRGRVVEMNVSGWDGERFRFPRYKKWRKDKSPRDCLFGEQVGSK